MTANPIQVTKRENYGEPHLGKEVLFSSRHILADGVRFYYLSQFSTVLKHSPFQIPRSCALHGKS